MRDLILGTAGHIDHGKTSLIRALTGTETDRLPEEKKRGITIELGYAQLELPPFRLGIVDVPGHEKFVRQMLAGATGMDLVLLVVAGDDSVKQQTIEHLDILRMLDLPAGVIALTKCDLSDPDWLELVEDEIRQMVSDTFLADVPIIRTSAKTGLGIDELKQALIQAAEKVAQTDRQQRLEAPFRMAVDRSFPIEGHGTVVTGSVNSGQLAIGDNLMLQPGHKSVRVRGIQNHDASSETVARGQRAAINLAGVHHNEIGRGHELCRPGHLKPSTLMTVKLSLLSRLNKPLKDRTRIRFHIGTAELIGNVRLLERPQLEPGESCFAQVFLNDPAVAVWHQPFVIRRQSPVETIGGGVVLSPNASRIKKASERDLEMLEQLHSGDHAGRASASLYFSQDLQWEHASLARDAGIVDTESAYRGLVEQGDAVEIRVSQTRRVVLHRERFEDLSERVLKTLKRMHADKPLRFHHSRSAVEAEFAYLEQPELLQLMIDFLKEQKQIIANVNSIGLVGYGPKLSKGQKALLEELVQTLRSAGVESPAAADLVKAAKKNKDSVAELLEMAVENGSLVGIAPGYYLHTDVYEQIKQKVFDAFAQQPEQTMSELRQVLDTSRKYAIPILEYLDQQGVTVREGDVRRLP